jgi:hypothetical protein
MFWEECASMILLKDTGKNSTVALMRYPTDIIQDDPLLLRPSHFESNHTPHPVTLLLSSIIPLA